MMMREKEKIPGRDSVDSKRLFDSLAVNFLVACAVEGVLYVSF